MRLSFTTTARRVLAALTLSTLAVGATAPAHAKSWCAYPLFVHEWGVHVFDSSGHTPGAGVPMVPGLVPDFFHRSVPGNIASGPSVRDLPPDGGERDLPVVQFYSPRGASANIPIGLEVGFTGGPASAWYPQIDLFRTAAEANGPRAAAARIALLAARGARNPIDYRGDGDGKVAPVPADPTRQLVWNRLDLTSEPRRPAVANSGKTGWVEDLRKIPALWVGGREESERFVFYEAQTAETVPLKLVRGDTFGPGRRHYELHNLGVHPVHDVFVVQRDGKRAFVFYAPMIPAKSSAGFLIEDHEVTGKGERAAMQDALRGTLIDAAQPAPPSEYRWDFDHCVMQRDPAIPTEKSEGHRLYTAEVDALMKVWGDRFFGQQGTTIVYREDTALLDQVMPLSVYTDMFNFVQLRRAGLAVWQGVTLP